MPTKIVDKKKVADDDKDYLIEDPPLKNQAFACVSFVSPEKILNEKRQWYYNAYVNDKMETYKSSFANDVKTIIENANGTTVDISQLIKLKKKYDKEFGKNIMEIDTFKEDFDDFIYKKGKELDKIFDENNNFQTSVRGFKVRGSFSTEQEAKIRASVLIKKEPHSNIFVVEVGKWVPWDPEANEIENQEYNNEYLNTLVREQKINHEKKELFFEEQRKNRIHEANTTNERLKKKLERKRAEELLRATTEGNDEVPPGTNENGENSGNNKAETDEVKIMRQVEDIDFEDPWIKRKKEELESIRNQEKQNTLETESNTEEK